MAMVSVARLVVVSNNADTFNDISKTVLQVMTAALYRTGEPPDDQFHKGPLVERDSFSEQWLGVHVGDNTNT
jgi:hypothetical protein